MLFACNAPSFVFFMIDGPFYYHDFTYLQANRKCENTSIFEKLIKYGFYIEPVFYKFDTHALTLLNFLDNPNFEPIKIVICDQKQYCMNYGIDYKCVEEQLPTSFATYMYDMLDALDYIKKFIVILALTRILTNTKKYNSTTIYSLDKNTTHVVEYEKNRPGRQIKSGSLSPPCVYKTGGKPPLCATFRLINQMRHVFFGGEKPFRSFVISSYKPLAKSSCVCVLVFHTASGWFIPTPQPCTL